MTKVDIYLHDLTPVAQQRVINAAGSTAIEQNFGICHIAQVTFDTPEYIPEIGHIVNVADPPDTFSAWSHAFTGSIIGLNSSEGYATVEDMDNNTFDIDFIYLSKDDTPKGH